MHVYYKERGWRSVSVNIQYISKKLFFLFVQSYMETLKASILMIFFFLHKFKLNYTH